MPRYKITVEYDGARFWGFQAQVGGPTVQVALEQAIAAFCGEHVRVHGAGRTDSGVHAIAMTVHFDLDVARDARTIAGALNFYLREQGVAVLGAEDVDDRFHARFSAKRRHYLYRIINRNAPLTFDDGRAWLVRAELDAEAMNEAAQVLVGHHDFSTFRHAQCQSKSPMKTLDYLTVEHEGREIFIHTGSRSFLHYQVRSIVGSLKLVGEGKWTAADLQQALERRNRTACGPVAPPEGLYFVAVDY